MLNLIITHGIDPGHHEALDFHPKRGHCGRLENASQGKLDPETVPNTRDELRAEERVAPNEEKVVVHADSIYAEEAGHES